MDRVSFRARRVLGSIVPTDSRVSWYINRPWLLLRCCNLSTIGDPVRNTSSNAENNPTLTLTLTYTRPPMFDRLQRRNNSHNILSPSLLADIPFSWRRLPQDSMKTPCAVVSSLKQLNRCRHQQYIAVLNRPLCATFHFEYELEVVKL